MINEWIEVTTISDWERKYIPGMSMSTADVMSEDVPFKRVKHNGVWRCSYCRMLNNITDLACAQCGAPCDHE